MTTEEEKKLEEAEVAVDIIIAALVDGGFLEYDPGEPLRAVVKDAIILAAKFHNQSSEL